MLLCVAALLEELLVFVVMLLEMVLGRPQPASARIAAAANTSKKVKDRRLRHAISGRLAGRGCGSACGRGRGGEYRRLTSFSLVVSGSASQFLHGNSYYVAETRS